MSDPSELFTPFVPLPPRYRPGLLIESERLDDLFVEDNIAYGLEQANRPVIGWSDDALEFSRGE